MKRILVLSILATLALTLMAVPARPGKKRITLPDGTTCEVVARGDERCHWLETTAGQIIGTRVTHPSILQQRPMPTRRKVSPADPNSLLLEGSFPTTGKHKLLALLVNYADTRPAYTAEDFDAMLNEPGYKGVGSFRDFYLDQSYGQLDITTTVTPWITVSQPRSFYNTDNAPSLIAEALSKIDADVDFNDYDNDGDGILDGLIVIHAGRGQESSSDANDIWSHSSTIYGMQYDGVSIFRYTIEPEQLNNGQCTIGVFCHEFGHNLGALDYYDTNYASDGAYGGTGPWDLMGEGAWNGSGGTGTHPAPFTAWQKWQFGWQVPETLDQSRHVADMEAGALHAEAYRMNTTTDGDYFILENIQNVSPWTSDLPGHGLIVTHVIESIIRQRMAMNNINSSYPQGIYTVCADAHSDPVAKEPASYGTTTTAATPFPGLRHHTTFSDETLPSTHSQDGRFGYIALTNIAESEAAEGTGAATITFDFIQGDAPQKPLDLTAVVAQGVVRLSWTFPAEKEQPVHCTVYRNDKSFSTIEAGADCTWSAIDDDCSELGLVSYTVDATYASGLTSAVSTTRTRIPQQVARDLTAEYVAPEAEAPEGEATGCIRLSWSKPTELTRCVNDLHYNIVDHSAKSFAYAHRFRADDLLPYLGQRVRAITFIPQQRSTDATFTVCVWRTLPGERPRDVLTSRKVSEFSPTFQRSVALVERPVIEAGYDYWIGVRIDSKLGMAEIVTDQAELIDGYGNMMSINDGAWQADPLAVGNYILAATLTDGSDESQTLFCNSTDGDATSLFGEPWTSLNPAIDLYNPLGFSLYCNGRKVAETTASTLDVPLGLLYPTAEGEFAFELTSAYKCGNESRPVSVVYTMDVTGISPIAIDAAGSDAPVYDLWGRRLQQPVKGGMCIVGGRIVIR